MPRLVRVGVIDSGINPRHPQVGSVAGGVGIHTRDGQVVIDGDWDDRLGHGTAVAATIRGRAPKAELFAIRIFRRRLTAHVEALLEAFNWAVEHELDMVCSSLGCAAVDRRDDFARALAKSPLLVVAAAFVDGSPSLPGALPDVLRVEADPELPPGALRHREGIFYAPPWARSLGPLPKERNLQGTSLAVAQVAGAAAARLMEGVSPSDVSTVLARIS